MDQEHSSPRLHFTEGGVAHIVFDAQDRSVNVLTEEVMVRLRELLGVVEGEIRSGRASALLLTSAKPSSFIAGANIDALDAVTTPDAGREVARLGQEIFLSLERLPIPTMAAIHGTALGGGFEIALAARYRVATDHPATKIGLPEVQLGILPAWGGTTRLPRLIGLTAAMDLILTGRTVSGKQALKLGIVDELLPATGFPAAAEALLLRWKESPPPARAKGGLLTRLLEGNPVGRRIIFGKAEKSVLKKTGGHYPAPLAILDLLRSAVSLPLEKALEEEAAAAGELIASKTSKNLIHVFRLRERARKGGGLTLPEESTVTRIGVLGAGVMGGGIAHLAASNGIQARLRDIRTEAIGDALRHASELFSYAAKKRKITGLEATAGMERISGGIDLSGFSQVQVVVEAVVEKMEVKKKVLSEVEDRLATDAILTSNTSSLSIDEMAKALRRPESFLGMHFFNPVHRMPLVEIVRGGATSEAAVSTIFALSLLMGKVPVVVRDGPGFLVNRILTPYLNEAGFLLGEGVPVEAIDRAATGFGMPMGPLRLIDEIGIDVMHHVGTILHQGLGERLSPAPALVALHASGRLGKKGGVGVYRHGGDDQAGVDPGIYAVVGAAPKGSSNISEGEIRDRLIFAMINEAARALEDEISTSAGEVDLAMIMGTGFPPFLGGLLRFADEVGAATVVERLTEMEKDAGPRFAPAPLLLGLAREKRGFYDAFPSST